MESYPYLLWLRFALNSQLNTDVFKEQTFTVPAGYNTVVESLTVRYSDVFIRDITPDIELQFLDIATNKQIGAVAIPGNLIATPGKDADYTIPPVFFPEEEPIKGLCAIASANIFSSYKIDYAFPYNGSFKVRAKIQNQLGDFNGVSILDIVLHTYNHAATNKLEYSK